MTTEQDLDIEAIDRVRETMGPEIAGLAARLLDALDRSRLRIDPEDA